MRKFNTQGIVLSRINYGETARIITFLTPDYGKVSVMAKGVRKSRSKLAGGIELFSVSDIGVLAGRGEVDTLMSSRLAAHFGEIVKDLDRTNLGYQFIKQLDKATESKTEPEYFQLLKQAFEVLDDRSTSLELVEAWFGAQLLKLAGHTPNLKTEKSGAKLAANKKYDFDFDAMAFQPGKTYSANQIKFLRLLFSANPPAVLQRVNAATELASRACSLIRSVLQIYIRI